jgi:hypothetical protein
LWRKGGKLEKLILGFNNFLQFSTSYSPLFSFLILSNLTHTRSISLHVKQTQQHHWTRWRSWVTETARKKQNSQWNLSRLVSKTESRTASFQVYGMVW